LDEKMMEMFRDVGMPLRPLDTSGARELGSVERQQRLSDWSSNVTLYTSEP
jgi:hypothetical protein